MAFSGEMERTRVIMKLWKQEEVRTTGRVSKNFKKDRRNLKSLRK